MNNNGNLQIVPCCINAGVAEVHLSGAPRCPDRCECHEKPEDWRPEA